MHIYKLIAFWLHQKIPLNKNQAKQIELVNKLSFPKNIFLS